MNFPIIENISDVLPALEGRDEFVVAKKDGYTVIDYRYALHDSFDDPIRRECRGLKFDPVSGILLARPLHKFFNYGEKEETQLNGGVLNFSDPHDVMEKMDGSMIHPCILSCQTTEDTVEEVVVFMTRMGHTDVAIKAEQHFLHGNGQLIYGLAETLCNGVTPVFEYIGPDNRIVEAYDAPELVLLQARDTRTGVYLDLPELEQLAVDLEVRLAPTYPAFTKHEDVLAVFARDTGGEGVILKFAKGLFVKIKSDEYRRLHRIRDDVTREHDLAKVVIDGSIDDAMPLFDAKTAAQVRSFSDAVLRGLQASADEVRRLVFSGTALDQKTFAVEHLREASPTIRTCAFSARKQVQSEGVVDTVATVTDYVLANTVNAERFERVRDLCGGARLSAPISTPEGFNG